MTDTCAHNYPVRLFSVIITIIHSSLKVLIPEGFWDDFFINLFIKNHLFELGVLY